MNARQVIAVGVVLGLTAAAVVWWLERYQTDRMTSIWREWLDSLPNTEAKGGD